MEPATNSDARDPLPGRLPRGFELGGYVVDGWLRDGGMASIHRARRTHDDRRVALKLQLPSTAHDPVIRARFDREAEVMRRASNNPHVVELYDTGVLADGRRYFAMEWVEGENLEDLLDFLRNQDQRLAIERACRIGRDVARGLSELHEHGVLHLDLKPANVMVGRGVDGRDEIKLVDFGVAADLREIQAGFPVAPVMGTSGYMAPERLHAEPPSPSCDVYALGVLMFETLAGTSVPPDGWTPETLPRIETRRRGIPAPLADLVHACMELDPARRPGSSREVASELVRIILALESEGRRDGRGASARVGPVRTGRTEVVPHASMERGGTDVVPRAEVPAEAPARTGGTEEARARGSADCSDALEEVTVDERPVGAKGAIVPPSTNEGEAADDEGAESTGSSEPWEEEGTPRPRGWIRWTTLGAVAAVVAVTWFAWDGGALDEWLSTAREEPRSGSSVSTARSTELGRMPEAGTVRGEQQGELRAKEALASDDAPSAKSRSGRVAAVMPGEPRTPATDADACKKTRASAKEAKQLRAWRKVLRVTAHRGCWSSAMLRRDRKRLRVQAYAELEEFGKCVREAGESTDAEIVSRVGYCMNGLRSR